ncbi:MAG TPA: hypothetical protein VJ742_00265 [Nitrososphaera sp.]|nr:hypothetical protein [Nitrososphaera sp.]
MELWPIRKRAEIEALQMTASNDRPEREAGEPVLAHNARRS